MNLDSYAVGIAIGSVTFFVCAVVLAWWYSR